VLFITLFVQIPKEVINNGPPNVGTQRLIKEKRPLLRRHTVLSIRQPNTVDSIKGIINNIER